MTDSNGRGLGRIFKTKRRDWSVYTIRVGRALPIVKAAFRSRIQTLRRFRPHCVVLHVGHNDVVRHDLYNPKGQHIKYFFPSVMEFVDLISRLLGGVRVIYSSLFPRSIGHGMDASDKYKYNKLAARYGVRAKSTCSSVGVPCVLNGGLWISVKRGLERASLFDAGGLHLSHDGRVVVVEGWIIAIIAAMAPVHC